MLHFSSIFRISTKMTTFSDRIGPLKSGNSQISKEFWHYNFRHVSCSPQQLSPHNFRHNHVRVIIYIFIANQLCGESCCGESYVAKVMWRKLCGESCCGESYVAKVAVAKFVAKVIVRDLHSPIKKRPRFLSQKAYTGHFWDFLQEQQNGYRRIKCCKNFSLKRLPSWFFLSLFVDSQKSPFFKIFYFLFKINILNAVFCYYSTEAAPIHISSHLFSSKSIRFKKISNYSKKPENG